MDEATLFIQTILDNNINPANIKTIFDVGSRDCKESIEFAKTFTNASVYAFECNPDTLPRCRDNIKEFKNITLIPKAVNSYNGMCKFYPVDLIKSHNDWPDKNPGASALSRFVNNSHPGYFQNEIEVECTTLKTVIEEEQIHGADIIWIDLQGAELIALQSMEHYLDKTKFIHVEVSHSQLFAKQCMFNDLNKFLIDRGFELLTGINTQRSFENAIYKKLN